MATSYIGAIFTTLGERKLKVAFTPTIKNSTAIFYDLIYIYIHIPEIESRASNVFARRTVRARTNNEGEGCESL